MFKIGPSQQINVGPQERAFSLGAGLTVFFYSFLVRPRWRWFNYIVGGGLFLRGVLGTSYLSKLLQPKPNGRTQARDYKSGIKISEMVTIDRPPEELYRVWRNFENLPTIMRHVQSVEVLDRKKSRWKVRGPAGTVIEWEAEIVRDFPNRLITWQSLENSAVIHAGSVSFEKTNGGTEVRVIVRYEPPGGSLGAAVAGLLGEEPERQIKEDLYQFKRMAEAGDLASAKR